MMDSCTRARTCTLTHSHSTDRSTRGQQGARQVVSSVCLIYTFWERECWLSVGLDVAAPSALRALTASSLPGTPSLHSQTTQAFPREVSSPGLCKDPLSLEETFGPTSAGSSVSVAKASARPRCRFRPPGGVSQALCTHTCLLLLLLPGPLQDPGQRPTTAPFPGPARGADVF